MEINLLRLFLSKFLHESSEIVCVCNFDIINQEY